jgi:hypothetical protein
LQQTEALLLRVLSAAIEIDDKALSQQIKGVNEADKVSAINALVEANRLLVSVNERGVPVYRYQTEEAARRMKDMGPEEYAVYERVAEARDRGITAVDLRQKLAAFGFTQVTLNKVLKKMEKQGTFKKLKSMQQKHKTVYMLMEVEPSAEVTGGLVSTDAFDPEAIQVLHARILEYLRSHGNTPFREIALYVKQMGVLKGEGELKEEHIRQIVQVLVFDQKIEPVHGAVDVFRLSGLMYPYGQLEYSGVPCAYCPVRSKCAPGSLINPQACEYMQQWQAQF